MRKVTAAAAVVVTGFLLATNPVVADAAKQITGKDIKNSSVTGKDVKDGSLRGADVKDGSIGSGDVTNGSLLAADFALGELPSTRAFQASEAGPVDFSSGALVTVGQLSLPQAGTYVVTSKVYVNNDGATDAFVRCTLSDGVVSDDSSTGLQADSGEDDHRTIGALLAYSAAGPSTVTLKCDRFAGTTVNANDVRIVAVKVGGLG